MAQVPECVVCLQPYDYSSHVPRVLLCGHSFCEPCLIELQSAQHASLLKSTAAETVVAVIRCPECSQRTRLPVGGPQYLPKNVELLRLLPSFAKEGDIPGDRKIDAQEKAGSSKEGRGTRIAFQRGTGKRNENERKSRGKGKHAFDLKSSPAGESSSIDSWLVPCNLFSENVKGKVRTWILPKNAIKVKEDSGELPFQRRLLRGEIALEQTTLQGRVLVTLLRLGLKCPRDETLSYEHCVIKAWEDFQNDVKTELLILFRVSLVCRRLCTILGLWMNTENELFLVSDVPTHETCSSWNMILEFCHTANLPACSSRKLKINESCVDGDEVSSLAVGISQMKLKNSLTEISLKVPFMDVLNKVGLGLCEAFLEIHSQGVIIGTSHPDCFVLDRFGMILVNLSAALHDRVLLQAAVSNYKNLRSTEFKSEAHECPVDDERDNSQSSNKLLQYISPEVLLLLINNFEHSEAIETSVGNNVSASDQVYGCVTRKADVYSLGCLLLELIAGTSPFGPLPSHEVASRVLVKREKPSALLSLDTLEGGADDQASKEFDKLDPFQTFKHLLSKCLEYNPDERPELHEIWQSLSALDSSHSLQKWIFAKHLQSDVHGIDSQKCWTFCRSGFVSDGYLDSSLTKMTDSQESERIPDPLQPRNDGEVERRETQSRGLELIETLEGHQDYVTALVVCGNYLLSASFDKTVRVWSLEDHQLLQTLEGHSSVVVALAVDQDTFRCFSADNSGKICAWKLGNDTKVPLVGTWQEHKNWRYSHVTSLAVSADGILYSGSGDKTIKSWSLQNFELLGKMEGHKSVVSALLVEGELLYSGSWDGTIRVWWRSDQTLLTVLGDTSSTHVMGGVRTLYMSDSFLYSGRENGAVQVWRDEECLTTVKAHDKILATMYVEGDFLYTASWDETIKAWRVDEFFSDPSPFIVRECGSALSSIVSDGDGLYAALANKYIKVYSL